MHTKIVLLPCLLLSIVSSCKGQNTQQASGDSYKYQAGATLGDTVTEMDKQVWYVFEDTQHQFWFGSDGKGIYRYTGKAMIHYTTKHGLCNDRIRDIQQDKSGNLYFTTLNGISKFDGRQFTRLSVAADNDPHNWKLEPDDLWFKSEDGRKGPYRYDGKTLYSLEFPKSQLEAAYYKKYPNTTIDPYALYYIYKDKQGAMWFGTAAFGLYRYDGTSLRHLHEEQLTLIKNGGSFGIRSILEDRSGKFWFCNTRYRYTILPGDSVAGGERWMNYSREPGISVSGNPLGGDRIYFQSVVEDKKGELWLQTYAGGIWRNDGKNMHHYPVKDGTADAKVITMYRDSAGQLWLGTDGSGVYQFNGTNFEPFRIL